MAGMGLSGQPSFPATTTVWKNSNGKRPAVENPDPAFEAKKNRFLADQRANEPWIDPFPREKDNLPQRKCQDKVELNKEEFGLINKTLYQEYFPTDNHKLFPRSVVHGKLSFDDQFTLRGSDVPRFPNGFRPTARRNVVLKFWKPSKDRKEEVEVESFGSLQTPSQQNAQVARIHKLQKEMEDLADEISDMSTPDDAMDVDPASTTVIPSVVQGPTTEDSTSAIDADEQAEPKPSFISRITQSLVNLVGQAKPTKNQLKNQQKKLRQKAAKAAKARGDKQSNESSTEKDSSSAVSPPVSEAMDVDSQVESAGQDDASQKVQSEQGDNESDRTTTTPKDLATTMHADFRKAEEQPEQEATDTIKQRKEARLAQVTEEWSSLSLPLNPENLAMRFIPCSARPGRAFDITIERDLDNRPTKIITCIQYATGLRYIDGNIAMKFHQNSSAVFGDTSKLLPLPIPTAWLPRGRYVREALTEKRLMMLNWWADPKIKTEEVSELKSLPVWEGISQAEVYALVARLQASDPTLKEWERLVAYLAKPKLFCTAYCDVSEECDMTSFSKWMRVVCFAAASLGNHWHHRIEAGRRIATDGFPYEAITSPIWTVQKWRVWSVLQQKGRYFESKQNDKYKLESVEPIEWAPYSKLAVRLFPDSHTLGHERMGHEAREARKGRIEVDRISRKDDTILLATAIRYPDPDKENNKDMYLFFLQAKGRSKEDERKIARPAFGTRAVVTACHEGKVVKFSASVVENVAKSKKKSKSHTPRAEEDGIITLWAIPQGNLPKPLDEKLRYEVRIRYVGDVISSNRAMNALQHVLDDKPTDPEGSWRKDILFSEQVPSSNTPSGQKYAANRSYFADVLRNDTVKMAAFSREYNIKLPNLNDAQKKSISKLLDPDAPTILLNFGVPGAGKTTYSLIPAIRCVAATGERVVVVASTNGAVDHVLEKLDGDFKEHPPQWTGYKPSHVTRFKSAFARPPQNDILDSDGDVEMDPGARLNATPFSGDWVDEVESQDLAMASDILHRSYFERAGLDEEDDDNAEYAFGRRKRRYIQDCLTDNDLREAAQQYLDLLEISKNGVFTTRKDRKTHKDMFFAADEEWTQRYLDYAKIIFVTTNSAGHDAIVKRFKPTVLFIDEAGQVSYGDLAILYDAFPTIKKTLMYGDTEQLGPFHIARSCNEFHEANGQAPFAVEIESASGGLTILNEQHRMHGDIAEFPTSTIYSDTGFERKVGKGMVTALHVNVDTDMDRTMKKINAKLFSLLPNGVHGRILFIDTHTMHSESEEGSTSQINASEAINIANTACQQVKNGVDPEEIMIICMYAGQATQISRHLYAQTDVPAARRCRIVSAQGCVGKEADIVLLALTSHVPGDAEARISWISQQNRINVAMTRARRFLWVFGNFRGWLGAIEAGNKSGQLSKKESAHFRKWILWGHDKNLRIDAEQFNKAIMGESVGKFIAAPIGPAIPAKTVKVAGSKPGTFAFRHKPPRNSQPAVRVKKRGRKKPAQAPSSSNSGPPNAGP